ncbi:MAG: hypothetical protein CR972_02830 [Candidatus Moraniibacteriota bacterium]|nr:MAG: hypothetical protein CR972_02830 [Candidatus Moranbacteria bacterium]
MTQETKKGLTPDQLFASRKKSFLDKIAGDVGQIVQQKKKQEDELQKKLIQTKKYSTIKEQNQNNDIKMNFENIPQGQSQSSKEDLAKKLAENNLIDGVTTGEDEEDLIEGSTTGENKEDLAKKLAENNLIDGVTTGEDEQVVDQENHDQQESGEKMKETASKESLGLRNDEEERLEKESQRRENQESQENQDQAERQEREIRLEQLKSVLDDARRNYTSLHYRNEGIIKRIKAVFGTMNTEGDNDLVNAKGEYQQALENYRNFLLEGMDGMSDTEEREAMMEVRKFDLHEGINLYEDRLIAKSESFPGKLGEYSLKAINQYKKLPTKWKIALSGVLLAGGVATGTGVAAGIFGAATIGKRALGAGVAGVGATGWLEARAQRRESADVEKSLAEFAEMSAEEQKALLRGFDNQSFQDLEKVFHGKIAGRSNRVMAGLGAMAGVMALGYAGKAFMAGETISTESAELPDAESENVNAENFKNDAFTDNETVNRLYEQEDLAKELARKMGINDLEEISFTSEGQVPTEINGMSVPEDLYTEEQKSSISVAREMSEKMNGVDQVTSQIDTNSTPLESDPNYTIPGVTEDISNTSEVTPEEMSEQPGGTPEETESVGESGWHTEQSHITIDANGIGTLEIGKGGSIEGALITFFTENSDKLTEGGMGWNPDKFGSVEEWAGKRAHGLVEEYAKIHPSVDLNVVQPGTTFDINLNNLGDIRIEEIEFEEGPRIVPEGEKVELSGASESSIEKSDSVNEISALTQLEELDALRNLATDSQFVPTTAAQAREIFGQSLQDIKSEQISDLMNNSDVKQQEALQAFIVRATDQLGEDVATPKSNATLGSYLTRMYVQAQHAGKIEEIFTVKK